MPIEICAAAAGIESDVIDWRRDFHRYPELGLQEKRTAARIAELLAHFGLSVVQNVGGTGVVGFLQGSSPGRTIMLRADMDALPIAEATGLAFQSQNPGLMHACAHDGHMAILLGVAKLLSARKAHLAGNIKFVFQPGEEGFGGAARMIRDGVMEDPAVDAAFGLHLVSTMPSGVVGLKAKAFMASMDTFTLHIRGKGGHAAMPEGGVDAILASAHVVTALQSLISREVSPLTPLVVHVGTIRGGEAFNVVAAETELKGTVRTLDSNLRKTMPERITRVVKGIVEALRATHELDYAFEYPVAVNDTLLTELVRNCAQAVPGLKGILDIPPTMGSDDMAEFLERVPGCYFFLGVGNKAKNTHHPHHNHRFDLDEDVLKTGVAIMARIALDYLRDTGLKA